MEQGFDEEHYHSVHLYEENQSFTTREKLAIEYAECFALDHKAINDEFFIRLKEHFSDEEILELTITIGFCVGMGRSLTAALEQIIKKGGNMGAKEIKIKLWHIHT